MDAGPAKQAAAPKSKPPPQSRRSLALKVTQDDFATSAATKGARSVYAVVGKRCLDVMVSFLFLLLVGSWLFPLIAVAIRIDSGGPVLFRQKRVGLQGRVFTCLKFRTMRHDPQAGFVQATLGDPRITRVGYWLRRSNFDELPQFINVVRGDMSLVGPRPHVPELDDLFAHKVPGYRQRISVRPGMTGLAQVSGARGETRSVQEMAQRVGLDLGYLRDYGLWVDLKIMIRTLGCIVVGDERAY